MRVAIHLLPLISIIRRITLAFAAVSFLMISVVVLILNHMVVVRLFGEPIVWHVELSIHLTLASFLLGAPYAVLTHSNVAVDLLPDALPPRAATRLRVAILICSLAVCFFLTMASAERAAHAFVTNERSTSLWAPELWPVYAAMPIGLGFACLQMIAEIIGLIASTPRNHIHE